MIARARIDDSLARAAERRSHVLELLGRLKSVPLNRFRLRELCRQLRLLAPEAPVILVDYLVEAQEEDVALVLALLPELNDLRVRERLQALLARQSLSAGLRQRLEQARIQVEEQLAPFGLPENLGEADPSTIWRYVAGPDWRELSGESLGLIWHLNFFPQAQRLRYRLMQHLHEAARERSIPVLELETHWGGKRMGPWVVRMIRDEGSQPFRDFLSRLALHRHRETRNAAQAALKVPRPAGPERLDRKNVAGEDPTIRCYMAETPSAENRKRKANFKNARDPKRALDAKAPRHCNLVIVQGEPEGRAKFLGMNLDLGERGVVECFGTDQFDLTGFYTLLGVFAAENEGAGEFKQIPASLGLLLANASAALSMRHGYVLPQEYFIWRSLVSGPLYDARNFSLGWSLGLRKRMKDWNSWIFEHTPDEAARPW